MQNYHAHAGIELECVVAPVVGTLAFVLAVGVGLFAVVVVVVDVVDCDDDLEMMPDGIFAVVVVVVVVAVIEMAAKENRLNDSD